ncbi:MAG: DUF2490 domain-containing protein [Methylovulum sp.]|uniref:DUF2490 domain-containing protein n=1 Tax=Methylovulum sp. TaxID=1916980 RepID=UPI00262921A3|nr:DUF2490 domain-containing protein [Methylovulum sp.]MDD2723570.1 DUF2490 domain-containing protein [Methylovulum sp.]MDD5124164.1 DUF2490 domain-containing protein [Methylovulum sp.]
MKKIKRLAMIIMCLDIMFLSSTAMADDGNLVENDGSWLQMVGEGSLKILDPRLEKTRIWLEGQSRYDGDFSHWYQGLARAAIGYSLSEHATVWAGYTWLPTQNLPANKFVSEQDVWPGFRYVLPTSFGTLSYRILIESNFLQDSNVRVRPRQMLRFMHPMAFEPRLSLIAWDELFIRANSTPYGGQSGFDQNRAFAGLGWTFNKNVRTELGYLNQYLDDASHTNNTMHNLVMGSIFINF